jgi:hypothetical protein
VEVSVHPQNGAVTIRPGIKCFDDGKVTRRFRAEVDRLFKERQQLYRNLAK